MPTNKDPVEVAVYYDNPSERELAVKILKEAEPTKDVRIYDGVVEGWISRDTRSALRQHGLLVDPLRPQTPPEVEYAEIESAEASSSEAAPPESGAQAFPTDETEIRPTLSFGAPESAPPRRSARARSMIFERSSRSNPALQRQLNKFREKANSQAAQEIKSRAQRSARGQGRSDARRSGEATTRSAGFEAMPPSPPAAFGASGGAEALAESALPTTESESTEDVYEVKLTGPMRPEWQDWFKQAGLEVCSFAPPNTYRMFLNDQQLESVQRLPFVQVQGVERYTLAETVTPDLLQALETAEQIAEPDDPTAAVTPELLASVAPSSTLPQIFEIIFHRAKDLPKVISIIRDEGGEILDQSEDTIRFKAAIESPLLAVLADLSEVKKIAPYQPPKLFSNFCRGLIGIDAVAESGAVKYTGQGEVVGVFDSGIDQTHPDFAGRVKEAISIGEGSEIDHVGHGTHVAGIIAGTGAASNDERICGIAPGAELVIVGITRDDASLDLPIDLGELLREAVARGAKIINLSWGTAIGGSYDQGSASVDKFVYENPEVLVVVAAGNEGRAPEGISKFSSVGTPATAKNVVTVGACATDRAGINKTWGTFRSSLFKKPPTSEMAAAGNPDLVAAISSRGPTDYDSVKPDLLAPGTFVLSARASHFLVQAWMDYPKHDNSYTYIGGTSMAAPVVSGAAAILRQYLREALETLKPTAALVKTILIASTKRLPALREDPEQKIGYPDFDQGYGRLDLRNVLPHPDAPAGRKLVFADVANDSPEALQSRMPVGAPRKSSRTYTVGVKADSSEPLTVVLAWTDWPGNGVMNNLQLDVRGPGGLATVGNPQHRFRKDPEFDDATDKGLAFDKRNNVEMVRIDPKTEALPGGVYRIRVVAQNTPFPPQGYAVCVCGELDSELTVE